MKTITIKKLFISAFALYSGFALCNTVTIVNSGSTFSPATVTITVGDTVKFTLASIHDAVEVSQATWNANGTTALSGGFSTPFGGGIVLNLPAGTHYYVCLNHASMGMKGVITVQSSAGIETINTQYPALSIYPNPASTIINLTISQLVNVNTNSIEVYNTIGECVHRQIITSANASSAFSEAKRNNNNEQNCQIDVSDLAEGVYQFTIHNSEFIITKRLVIVR